MAKLKIIKNMIDRNTGLPYREGTVMMVADSKRVKELVEAGVAVEIKEQK